MFKKHALFALIAGLFYALGHPSFLGKTLLITPILGISILLYLFSLELNLKQKFLRLTLFNLGYNLLGFYWITSTLQEFGELPFIAAFLLALLFTFVITPQLYLFLLFDHYTFKKRESLSPSLNIILMAFVYTTLEYFTPQQFPVMVGQPWAIFGEYLGLANIGGIPFYTFFSLIIAYNLVRFAKEKKYSPFHLILLIIFIVLNPIINLTAQALNPKELNVRLVQANISSFLKVDAEKGTYASVGEVIRRYQELSLKESDKNIDLIIWPETAYPYSIERDPNDIQLTELPFAFKDIALKHKSDLFIGGYDHKVTRKDYFKSEYNTNFHISPDGNLKDVYHKHILIPFGETLPFPHFINEKLAPLLRNISFFAEGEKFSVFKTQSGHSFINTICYEVLKPEFVRDYLNTIEERPHALINLTNDSWYGDTSEPEQHLFLTIWRALEFDLPIIRSTNTGISTIVNIHAQEEKRLGVGVAGNLEHSLKLGKRAATIYQKLGYLSMIILFVIVFLFQILLIKYKHNEE